MHAHEKTLLARLGFQDPDRKNPRHDLACRFIARPENIGRALEHVAPGLRISDLVAQHEAPLCKGDGNYRTHIGFADLIFSYDAGLRVLLKPLLGTLEVARESTARIERCLCLVEVKISKEPVADILRQLKLYREYIGGQSDRDRVRTENFWLDAPSHENSEDWRIRRELWDVINGPSVAKASATLNKLFRQTFVFLDWQISAGDAALFRSQGVVPFKLGARFEAFIAEGSAQASDVPEL